MIGFFPDPFTDELLYSVCARYSDYMRYPSKGDPKNKMSSLCG